MGIQKSRRCGRSGGPDALRWDFTSEDSNAFPMYVSKGGFKYGFCPGKASWDSEAIYFYQILQITAETGQMLWAGGLADQPAIYVNLLSWFLPLYDKVKFAAKAQMILGDGKVSKPQEGGRKIGR